MAPACALGSASSAPSLGCAEQFGVDDVPGSNGLAAVANAVTGSASALSARSDTEGTAFDSPWGAESASILRQCRLLTTPFQPPARTRPSSSDGGSSVQAAPARLSSSADSFESAQSVAFPCSVAMPSMSVESASGISTDIEVIAQAPTHAEKLAAAARFFGIGPDAGPRTTVVTKAKGGASLTFSAFWPASPAECNALLDQTVAAAERVEGCRKRVCRICDPASPRTNFRRHLEQHMGVSYMCDAIGCGRVFRGSHVNLLQHVDKCRGGKR
ncbi:hypothetical protein FNF29_02512 [Cafeteria roenbergensis]|uniref:Uncharacterized protein n=1 Tax=Cafeteria roenbergensis TaxID=33653 RepID=A0A5A8CMR2_CAFRO|nr:hypothetical protein FNF29_02512 [Cafeteria roenbergensis]|eukprot:KAA0154292.1 hypothetical protein FNF29_02512 [Cafeteria roenbergensis]